MVMMSRNEDILQAMIDGRESSTLPNPQSREEALLIKVLDKINAGGGGGGLSRHICTSDEYDHLTGVPTIENPDETTLYFVPSNTSENDMYEEWFFVDGGWEHFGAASSTGGETYTFSEGNVNGAFVVTSSSGAAQTVHVHGLRDICFVNESDPTLILDAGSIDD